MWQLIAQKKGNFISLDSNQRKGQVSCSCKSIVGVIKGAFTCLVGTPTHPSQPSPQPGLSSRPLWESGVCQQLALMSQ